MVHQEEKDFVEMFLATLCSMDKHEIPYDNELFSNGLAQASEYFNTANIPDEVKQKLALLFIKQTTYGEYLRMQNIIENMNGRIISLKNPHYVRAEINMGKDYIDYLHDSIDLRVDHDFYRGIATAFCEGAKI
ncbi:MAG: hypothetical protein FWD25_02295 [Clostridia bacterium]|nr:hypothetical protein [Clostridia bacterium]